MVRKATIGIILLDMAAIACSVFLTFYIRFNFHIPANEHYNLAFLLLLTLPVRIGSLYWHSIYRSLPRYVSIRDLENIIKGVVVAQIFVAASVVLLNHRNFPRSVILIEPIVSMILIGGIRLSSRIFREYRRRKENHLNLQSLLIFGAGDLGETVFRSIRSTVPPQYNIVGFLDDNPAKWRKHIHGLPIFGGRKLLPEIIKDHKIDVVIIAISHARASLIRDLMEIHSQSPHHRKVVFRIMPTVPEYLKSIEKGVANSRKIELADLLPRKETRLDSNKISHIIEGKTVLVTGAGGTIGGELCRQLLRFRPKALLLLEKNNTALFYADRAMHQIIHESQVVAISGDVQDKNLLNNIFQTYGPQIVFHAAAHKHAPLMESNAQEAIKNNTLATWLLAETAVKYNCERFLFISTDKAVRPSSVMGASKRLGEMIIRSMSNEGKTRFMSVRFGNVLGSSGSVVEIFQEQLASGGGLTVTHPEMTRYFMTKEEAIQLILQACALSTGGEIFVLNMGTPVKVVDLARNFIILNGLEPDKDVPIRFIGVRPGEKLHEQLFSSNEKLKDTGHPDIFMTVPEETDAALSKDQLATLKELSSSPDPLPLLREIKGIVSSFSSDVPLANGEAVKL